MILKVFFLKKGNKNSVRISLDSNKLFLLPSSVFKIDRILLLTATKQQVFHIFSGICTTNSEQSSSDNK